MMINLCPVDYLMRIIARTIDRHGTDPVVVLYAQKWLARLPMAMDFAIAGEKRSTFVESGGLP